jgi:hypothetical protein
MSPGGALKTKPWGRLDAGARVVMGILSCVPNPSPKRRPSHHGQRSHFAARTQLTVVENSSLRAACSGSLLKLCHLSQPRNVYTEPQEECTDFFTDAVERNIGNRIGIIVADMARVWSKSETDELYFAAAADELGDSLLKIICGRAPTARMPVADDQ